MAELYQNLGFNTNPFSTFSAEEERAFLKDIYIKPLFFETLKSDLIKGFSRFIIGARGIGKTALIIQLKEALESDGAFGVIIDEFDGISTKNNEVDFIKLIIQKLTTSFSIELGRNPKLLKKLSKEDKEKLAFVVKEFFKTMSASQYERVYNHTNKYKKRNFLRNIWNNLLNKPINFLISGGIEVVSETVRKSLGLPAVSSDQFYKNYIPELPLEKIDKDSNTEAILKSFSALKGILNDLCEIIKKCEFKTTVIFFDKIDEYTKLHSSISAVSDFLESFLKDTTVLMNENYSLVFSIWDVLKPDLTNKGVRFDKIKPIDITWKKENLEQILEKRIKFFSKNQLSSNQIISPTLLNSIIELSNNSPRYLFRQLSYIYDQQFELDNNASEFSDTAISNGQLMYANNFDYYALYPTKRNSKEDILTNINRLLKIGKSTIKTNDYVAVFKVSIPTAISYIKIVQEYDLVKSLTELKMVASCILLKIQ